MTERPRQTILVTGGAGFIGSHTCVDLLENGYDVVVIDNFTNSSPIALDRVTALCGRAPTSYAIDLRDSDAVDGVFAAHPIDAVVHFAAFKAVGESVQQPLAYYDNNLRSMIVLLESMRRHGVTKLVFSSSCSIYGDAQGTVLDETTAIRPTNPYSRTKAMGEQILADTCVEWAELRVVALRYFNPTGAHESGQLGEDPRGIPNNLMPYVMQVAVGRLPQLRVFGGDYATVDGTGVRDYIHVMDLAEGHRVAVDQLVAPGLQVFNLGTGTGSSVLQVVAAFERASGRSIPYEVVGRRVGDVEALVADTTLASTELGWVACRDLDAMCRDAWLFQSRNPDGYQT
jgi:UDP-glucose 4-epimerase